MPSTRDIRRRIKSVKNTAQITKAMQMVASSKMRKAQQMALSGRPYAGLMVRVVTAAPHHAGEAGRDVEDPRRDRPPAGHHARAGADAPPDEPVPHAHPDRGEPGREQDGGGEPRERARAVEEDLHADAG